MRANIPGVLSPNANQPDVSKSSDTHVNERTIVEGKKKRNILVIPLKSVWYRAGIHSEGSRSEFKNSAAVTWLLCPSISSFFFLILFQHVARKLQTTNPGDFNKANDAVVGEGGPVSSNLFGKAPSSVKIKGTVERFTAGRHEGEEATCVQSYHLAGTRTYSRCSP